MFVYYVLESFCIKVWIFFIDQRSEITEIISFLIYNFILLLRKRGDSTKTAYLIWAIC